jgi:CHAD domain-containing protein
MAKARAIPGFADATSFKNAAGLAVAVRTEEVFAHSDGVLDTADIERVHDMRVATRRLRAAMEIFAACFPKKEHHQLLREVKTLADVLGERRDPDVLVAALDKLADGLTANERPGIRHLVAELRAQQAEANERLAAELRRVASEGLCDRLLALAASATGKAA